MPKKTKPHRPASQNLPAVSDYETDFGGNLDHAPVPPRTNDELNISVLRRHNPQIAAIESVAPYAVLYLFSPHTQQWEKFGIEGTMFLCRLHDDGKNDGLDGSNGHGNALSPPLERYSVVILNRRGLDNFDAELLSDDDVELSDEYTILQVHEPDGSTSVFGIWIFEEPAPSSTARMREIHAAKLMDLARRAADSRAAAAEEAQARLAEAMRAVQQSGLPTAGKQLDLGELFRQNRGVNVGSPFPPPPHPPAELQQYIGHPGPQAGIQIPGAQGDHQALLALFHKAEEQRRMGGQPYG